MQLLAWLLVSLLFAIALNKRPFGCALAALILWCAMPGSAGHYLTGFRTGFTWVHPAAVFITTVLVVQAVLGWPALRRVLKERRSWVNIALIVILVAASGTTSFGSRWSLITAVVDQLIGPLALFFLLGAAIDEHPRRLLRLRSTILTIAAVESVLAIIQAQARRTFVWSEDYARQYWFSEDFNRWMGTFDHPLILSFFLSCAIFLLAGLRRWWLIAGLLTLFSVGILMTESRVGSIVALLGWIYVMLRGRVNGAGRTAFVLATAAAAYTGYRLGAGEALRARITDDSGSLGARQQALGYFLEHWSDFIWTSRGLNASLAFAREVGLETSFESSFLMYAIDLGLITAVLYFGWIVAILLRSGSLGALPGSIAAAAVGLVEVQSFSGLSGITAVPAVLWSLLALAAFSANRTAAKAPSRPLVAAVLQH